MTTRTSQRLGIALSAAFGVGLVLALASSCELLVSTGELQDGKCAADHKLCFGKCVPKGPSNGCSMDGCTPCVFPNATATCSQFGTCVIGACINDYQPCKAPPACDTDTAHSATNCGACNFVCPAVDHAKPGCSAKNCAVGGCDPGYEDCDRMYINGCETNLLTNDKHCGTCGHACPAGQTCQNGACG